MAYTPERFPCEKLFLIIFNFFAWLISLAFLTIAAWSWYIKGYYDELVQGILQKSNSGSIKVDPVLLIAALGILVFIISFVGCVGSLRENICLLKFFTGVITSLVLLQVIAGVLIILYPDFFTLKLDDFLQETIKDYRDDVDLQNIIDFTQKQFECCGGKSVDDWDANKYFACNNPIIVNKIEYTSVEACGVPYSCCKEVEAEKPANITDLEIESQVINTQCGYGVRNRDKNELSKIYQEGCIVKFEAFITRDMYWLIAAVGIIFALQIIPLFLANSSISTIHEVVEYNKHLERRNERRLDQEYNRQVRALRRIEDENRRNERVSNRLFEGTLGYFTIQRNRNPPPYNPEVIGNPEFDTLNPPQPKPRNRNKNKNNSAETSGNRSSENRSSGNRSSRDNSGNRSSGNRSSSQNSRRAANRK